MEIPRAQLVHSFVELMERISVQRRSRPPEQWAEFELTMPQVRTLFLLSQGPKRMSEVADYLGRGMSAATSMVDRLVRKLLVERLAEASDRRVVACRLTPAGREAVERFWRMGRRRSEAVAGLLTENELATVVPALEVLAEAMGRQAEPAGVPGERAGGGGGADGRPVGSRL